MFQLSFCSSFLLRVLSLFFLLHSCHNAHASAFACLQILNRMKQPSQPAAALAVRTISSGMYLLPSSLERRPYTCTRISLVVGQIVSFRFFSSPLSYIYAYVNHIFAHMLIIYLRVC